MSGFVTLSSICCQVQVIPMTNMHIPPSGPPPQPLTTPSPPNPPIYKTPPSLPCDDDAAVRSSATPPPPAQRGLQREGEGPAEACGTSLVGCVGHAAVRAPVGGGDQLFGGPGRQCGGGDVCGVRCEYVQGGCWDGCVRGVCSQHRLPRRRISLLRGQLLRPCGSDDVHRVSGEFVECCWVNRMHC